MSVGYDPIGRDNLKKICVVGLGYVGLPLAVEFGKVRQVIGFDTNRTRIEELNKNYDATHECSSEQLSQALNLELTSEIKKINDAQIYILTVPTPIDHVKRPNLKPLIEASKIVGQVLKKGDLVIYESTVFPGATDEICIPVLEKESGLTLNNEFFCGYSPERINPGDKVYTLTQIKKITSGSNSQSAKEIDELYNSIISAGTWPVSSIKIAEAAKVIENSQRDLNIAFVNELSLIFERLNIDTTEVLEAAGSKWNFIPFRPGMVGGHCIGVDPYYLTYKAEQLGYNPEVILAGRRINDNMARYAAQSIVKRMLQGGHNITNSTVGVMGVTFKENCPDVRNSKVFDLIKELESWNIKVRATDPWAKPEEVISDYGVELVEPKDLTGVSALIVAVGHDEFRNMSAKDYRSICSVKGAVFGDLKSICKKNELLSAGFNVFRL